MTVADALRDTWRAGRGFDPFYTVWRALTSVRVAIYLLGLVALGALLGTVFPQMPGPMRGNAAARAAWLEFQRGRFGAFTPLLDRLQLFEVFHTAWFNGLLILVLVAVALCTANRITPTWRGITRLQTRAPETYFGRARHRARRDEPVDPDALVAALRRRRYLVRRYEEAGTVYVYGDRNRWAQLATFVSHLSLIVLLAGGIVTKLLGYEMQLLIPEGRTAPVFPVVNDRQMQLEVKSFTEPRDEQGRVLDFRSRVVLYSRGVPVKEGDITVNGPLKWNGFVFHQAARQVNGAELQVRDRKSGQLLYNEVLNLYQGAPSPRLTIRDGQDQVVFDQRLVLPLFGDAGPAGTPAAVIPHPAGGRNLVVVLRPAERRWRMEIAEVGGAAVGVRAFLFQGDAAQIDGFTFSFAGMTDAAWDQVTGIPGVRDGAVALMSNAGATGVRDAALPTTGGDANETSSLTIGTPITWQPAFPDQGMVTLPLGKPVQVGDYEYTFTARRAFTGIVARRDPGTWLIWVAVVLLVGALCVTFYFPRRRLWAKVGPAGTLAAGVADRGSRYGEELQRLLDGLPAAGRPVVEGRVP